MTAKETGVKYALVDAFTSTPFTGNPASVCLLDDNPASHSDASMQFVAKEFNVSITAFVSPHNPPIPQKPDASPHPPRFGLRWFTPVTEIDLCGHGTLAAAHFLFEVGRVGGDVVEFVTRSGVLAAKRVGAGRGDDDVSSIELEFPVVEVMECEGTELPSIPLTLGTASVVAEKKTASGDLLVELSSGKDVANLVPHFDELKKCAGRGVLVTGPGPHGSGFDFYSRFFCPKFGVDEDPVCGSAHCALAPYWREKLGKCDLVAYMASPRGGRLFLHLEKKTQHVHIRGEAVTVMVGTLLA